jgi:hypothetical protein
LSKYFIFFSESTQKLKHNGSNTSLIVFWSLKKKYLDQEEEEVEVFETLCFSFCGISEKKLKDLDKEDVVRNKHW